jgi:hypothetical protein
MLLTMVLIEYFILYRSSKLFALWMGKTKGFTKTKSLGWV